MHHGKRGGNEPVEAYERQCDGTRRQATVHEGRQKAAEEGGRLGLGRISWYSALGLNLTYKDARLAG